MKKVLKLAAGLVILSVLVALSGPGRVLEGMKKVGPGAFSLAALLYLSGQTVCSYRWMVTSRALGVERPFAVHVVLYLSGMFLNLFLPTAVGGDLGRAYLLAGRERWQMGFASVVGERYAGFVVLSFILSACSLFNGDFLPDGVRLFFLSAFPLSLAIPVIYTRLGMPLKRRFLGEKLEVFDAVGRLFTRGDVAGKALGSSLVFYLLYIALHYVVILRVWGDMDISSLAVVVTATSLVSMIPVSPGGLGVREGGYAFFLSLLGIPTPVGVAFGISVLAVNLFLSLVGGLLLFLLRSTQKI
ncbi:MAG: UPF0104 family protein [Deltaproteobacteria bacterium]|nr:MAG: UPF0104 family protein [Deltaproteobacteria bacterium]